MDCNLGADETAFKFKCAQYGIEGFPCSDEEIQCKSGKCLPPNSSPALESQCHSKNTTFLYQLTNTTCPSDYNCKQGNVFLRPICLRKEEICDGMPHCPHWDDEIACPHSHCPPGCSSCTYDTYRCIPDVVRNIPSQASSIDVSGHVLNLTILCSLARPKLLSLNISNCNLKDISCISHSFHSLMHLDVSNNNLVFPFINPGLGLTVILDGNPVIALRYPYPCANLFIHKLSLKHSYIENAIFGTHLDAYDSGYIFLREDIHPLDLSENVSVNCNMITIDLSDNSMQSISFLSACSNLKFIDLSKNHVNELAENLNFTHMIHFALSDNFVSFISAQVFSGMPNIRFLDLSRNRIESIASDAFYHNRNLRELCLNNNRLNDLQLTLFHNLAKLEVLKLDDNSIEILQPEIFKNLESLKTLQINQNKLRFISRGVLSPLSSLKTLDLRGNQIVVRKDMFFGLSKLRLLTVDKWFLCCVRPKTISFENCHAPSISLSSCSHLLQFGYLRVYLCYLMFIICSGNVSFIYHEWKNGCYSSLRNLLVHLSLAHIVVFISFLGMIYKDVESRGEYGLHHEEWMNSSQCHALMVLSIFGFEATTIWSFVISLRKMFSTKIMRNKHNILLIFLTWLVILIIVVVYIILRKFDFSTTSSFEQICVFMPIFYRYDNADADSVWKRKWIYAWIITHSFSFVGIFSSHIVMAKKHGLSIMLRKMKDPMVLSAVAVAMRDIIICVIVYLQIVMITPDVLREIILCVIPTCSAIHTIIVIAFKQEQIFKIKEIIPTGILSKFDVQEGSEMKLIIVFDRVLKGRIQKKDIVIVFSDGSGWKETTGNLRILKKVLICRAPVYQGNVNKDVVDIVLKVKNRSNESIIAHGLIQYDVSQRCTTKARFEIN